MRVCLYALVLLALGVWADPEDAVTCGSVVKIKHVDTGRRLHSHEVNYGSGSGQQSVTGYEGSTDANSFWVVRPAHGKACSRGDPIKGGQIVRLEHMHTGKNLHSHLFPSPISNKQEVSCFRHDNGDGDTGDNWKVDLKGTWRKGKKFTLTHVDTQKYLSSNARNSFPRPISGQLEVACAPKKDYWVAEEGVYFSKVEDEED